MIRWLLLLLALLAPLSAATAGSRAVYRTADGKRLLIEVADSGEARVQEAESGDYGVLRRDGFYMVGAEDNALQVARIEDVATAIDRVVPPLFAGVFDGTLKPAPLRSEAKGDRTVAGIPGKVIALYGLDDGDPAKAETFVVSADPRLAPVGKTMEAFMNASIVPSAALIGPGVRDVIAQTRAIFALGTPLDAGGRFQLESFEPSAKVGEDRTALPAKPQTVDEIEAALRRSMEANTPPKPAH